MTVLAVTWSAVFIGLGAFLAGVGSVLSGMAALRMARKEKGDKKDETS